MEEKIILNLKGQVELYESLEEYVVDGFGLDVYLERMNLEKSEEVQRLIKQRNEVQERLYKMLGVKR